ncbi:hypothetical protein HanXRQr2_Chr04g0144221 [Helianthus annuus]|uniref:Uncharacterized protein n=1 Tax=Helianthus annuus TaxID=4232 RepID=A0A9K3NPT8_HELAN|nr:hypothetical protein HanXRQr2_Chr04g0144221 [Helianthus annuus]
MFNKLIPISSLFLVLISLNWVLLPSAFQVPNKVSNLNRHEFHRFKYKIQNTQVSGFAHSGVSINCNL